MTSDVTIDRAQRPGPPAAVRGLLVVALLYLFLAGVGMLEAGIKNLGADLQEGLFASVDNPLAGLFVGILATVLAQVSSGPACCRSSPRCR